MHGSTYPAAEFGRTYTLTPRRRGGAGVVFFGVVLPAFAVVVELATRWCRDAFFDPLPTPWHALLALAVPAGNLAVWSVTRAPIVRPPPPRRLTLLGLFNGLALGVGLYYTILFFPLLPLALIALIIFGLGLLPMGPIFGFASAWSCRRRLTEWANAGRTGASPVRVRGLWLGMAAGLLVVTGLRAPALLTQHGLRLAASDSPDDRERGVRLLRDWGSRGEMLRACYPLRSRGGSGLDLLASRGKRVTAEEAQQAVYRVTGVPFDAFGPPPGSARGWLDGEWDDSTWDEPDWDTDEVLRGGHDIGTRLPGLSLASSRIDGSVNAEAATSYFEWTFLFDNDKSFPQEARTRISLPPGGVVSRLTLWINGEEREAAFGRRGQVREAYEQVVKVQRRDPVLVTTVGPDLVQMQCFPVPAHGTMKVRVGMTAPLQLSDRASGAVQLPYLVDRNFAVAGGNVHVVWVESRAPLHASAEGLHASSEPPAAEGAPARATRGVLTDAQLAGRVLLSAQRPAGVDAVWFEDPFDASVGAVVQRVEAYAEPAPPRVVLAVDASASTRGKLSAVADALAGLPPGVKLTALAAADERVVELTSPNAAAGVVAGALRRLECRGGQDAVPLLRRAWELAAAEPGALVLWVHGPQPVLIDPAEPLMQRFERRAGAPRLLELQLAAGQNRVSDALSGWAWAEPVRSQIASDAAAGLRELFAGWREGTPKLRLARRRAPQPPTGDGVRRGDIEVVRLWAYEESLRLSRSHAAGAEDQAVALAVKHHLVTPLTGAVVLETQEQYDAVGLRPVSAVPLPPGVWMALATLPLMALAWRRWRTRAGGA